MFCCCMGILSVVVDACWFLKVTTILYQYKSHFFGVCFCLTTAPTSCTVHYRKSVENKTSEIDRMVYNDENVVGNGSFHSFVGKVA